MSLGKRFILPVLFLLGILMAVGFAGCGTASLTDPPENLPQVDTIQPPKLPDWIEEISPKGNAKPQAQIRIRFKEPLIPLEQLESETQRQLLQKFEIVPKLPGQFRFLTPRMVGFQADAATPLATRVKVTLKAGLADLKNHKLDQDLSWTFQTDRLQLKDLTTSYEKENPTTPVNPIALKPTLQLVSNVELDQGSLQEHAKLIPQGQADSVPMTVRLEKQPEFLAVEPDDPETNFYPDRRQWLYALEPQRELAKATPYTFEITSGLRPLKGNLPSETAFQSRVATYGPLSYQTLKLVGKPDAGGNYGRFVNGVAQFEFNNPIQADSVLNHVRITPDPKNQDVPLVRAYDGERVINLNPWALEAGKKYTITLGKEIKDTFGQTLEKDISVDYQTGDLAPDLWVPSNLNIFPSSTNSQSELQLNISTVNLNQYKAAYQIVQPTDLVYASSAYPQGRENDLLPPVASWKTEKVVNTKNAALETPVPLRSLLGGSTGMLAYGVQARTSQYVENGKTQWAEPAFYGLVQMTNLGVFGQWFPESGLVRVHHLSDGQAVANATVEVYRSQLEAKSFPPPTPCATGKTNAEGMVTFAAEPFQTCRQASADVAPPLLVIAKEGKDWAFTRSYEYSGAYGYGVDAGWDKGKPESRGTIFSDRQLYKPGETAYFTGLAYYLQGGSLKQDKNTDYTVTLEGPEGQKKTLGKPKTNAFGTFSLDVPLEQTQALGFYTVRAASSSGAEITGEFRIADFKPPNFKVELSLDAPSKGNGIVNQDLQSFSPDLRPVETAIALTNEVVKASVQSNYLFGAPVQGGEAQYFVTRRQTEFSPQGWEGYHFGQRWFWPERAPEVASEVLQTTQKLNETGQGTLDVTVDKTLPYPMLYQVDAQVADVSNLSVADSQSFVALPSDRLIGLKTDFVANAGKDFPVQVIVTDPAGQLLSDRVQVELQEMKYSNITRVVEGSRVAQDQVEYTTVDTQTANVRGEAATLKLTPPKSGAYRLRATLNGDTATATDVQVWATGPEAAFWGDRYSNERLELKLDKPSYRVGETATVLLQSPFPEAELYFAVIRHDTLYQTVTKVSGSAPQIQFTVTPDMLPNAAVEAVLVRQGKPLAQTEPGTLNGLVRVGFGPFSTITDDKYLNVEIAPTAGAEAANAAAPGSEQTLNLTLKDATGNPTQGQLTVMVVNEAVLQLSGYRPPDLVKTVFAEQPIATRWSDNRPDVVLQPMASPLQKGWGYGGGLSSGAANTRTRTDFKPIAYYNGAVMTDTNGNATVKFTLPDDLTTWRVMAVAIAGDPQQGNGSSATWAFGQGDTTFVTSKPVVTNPILPQFARPGDRFQVGVAVTNNTGSNGKVAIQGTVTQPLQFDNSNGQQETTSTTGTSGYRFPVKVAQAGAATVEFTTQLNGATDAFKVPLEVKAQTVMEQVIEAGSTTDQAKVALSVDQKVVNDSGGLDLTLASTLVPQLTAPAQQTLDPEMLPFLEPTASQLSLVANLQSLGKTYQQTFSGFDLKQRADQAIAQLQTLRKPDGGFATYPEGKQSDPFVTPYGAIAIAQARTAFGDAIVNPTMVDGLRTYLTKLLANPGQYDFCNNPLCKNQVRLETLIALAALGDTRTEYLPDLYAQRKDFDPLQQMKLARYLAQFPDWQTEATAIAAEFQESTTETGRSARVNLPENWRWHASPVTTQAEALQLAIAQKTRPDTINKLAQGLLAQRRNGTWQTTYDNAQALAALVAYSQLQPTPPNFTATAKLAGKTLASTQFQGYRKPSETVNIPMTDLPRGQNDLTLAKSGNGTLHYLAAYRYRLSGDQPGQLQGLRVTRTIRPANEEKALYTTGLYVLKPLQLPVGQVYDIGLEIITDHPVDHVVITDPLPAGFESVDESFQTTTRYFKAKGDSWQVGYQTLHKDRVVAFGDKLNPGVYTLHYLVRSVTPGTFVYPGAEAHLQYAPEEFGRSAATTLTIEE